MSGLNDLLPAIPPADISFWPPALGWWLLPAVLLMLIAVGVTLRTYWRYRQIQRVNAPPEALDQREEALVTLHQLDRPYGGKPANAWLQQINALLKRLCRTDYPDMQAHTLSGRAWLAFLDNRCPAAGLTRWMVLVEGPYRGECILDDKAIDGLLQAVDIWIRKHV